jgi:DNA-binding response OmpR family regulator
MGLKVLIAEDDDAFRFPIANFLEDVGFEVIEAENYDRAVELAREADIWVIDVRLPTNKHEGILAVKDLAERGIRSAYPVYFISVIPLSLAENELQYLRQHNISFDWIEKPFEPELLIKRIRESRV